MLTLHTLKKPIMKRKLNLFLALACLFSGLFLASCEKSSLKENERPALEISASTKPGDEGLAEGREYKMTDVTVELTDVGREQLIRDGYSTIRKTGSLTYITDINDNPWEPYDPIICDGMTYSQIWDDIRTKFNNFMNSPQGQSAKAYANATCRPARICIANCDYQVAEHVAVSKLSAQFVEEAP
jgi:hypothetical protein